MTKRRQLLSSDDAVPATRQHRKPCSDCPFARTALPGWLGGTTGPEWLTDAHTDVEIDCHVFAGAQCAGAAIYRRNVCKLVDPPLLRLERDTEVVFATPFEFAEHHGFEVEPIIPHSIAARKR